MLLRFVLTLLVTALALDAHTQVVPATNPVYLRILDEECVAPFMKACVGWQVKTPGTEAPPPGMPGDPITVKRSEPPFCLPGPTPSGIKAPQFDGETICLTSEVPMKLSAGTRDANEFIAARYHACQVLVQFSATEPGSDLRKCWRSVPTVEELKKTTATMQNALKETLNAIKGASEDKTKTAGRK